MPRKTPLFGMNLFYHDEPIISAEDVRPGSDYNGPLQPDVQNTLNYNFRRMDFILQSILDGTLAFNSIRTTRDVESGRDVIVGRNLVIRGALQLPRDERPTPHVILDFGDALVHASSNNQHKRLTATRGGDSIPNVNAKAPFTPGNEGLQVATGDYPLVFTIGEVGETLIDTQYSRNVRLNIAYDKLPIGLTSIIVAFSMNDGASYPLSHTFTGEEITGNRSFLSDVITLSDDVSHVRITFNGTNSSDVDFKIQRIAIIGEGTPALEGFYLGKGGGDVWGVTSFNDRLNVDEEIRFISNRAKFTLGNKTTNSPTEFFSLSPASIQLGLNSRALQLTGQGKNGLTYNGDTVWHRGNQGDGSGLDADLLDGLDSSQFLRKDKSETLSYHLNVLAGIMIDGVDISVLKSDHDQLRGEFDSHTHDGQDAPQVRSEHILAREPALPESDFALSLQSVLDTMQDMLNSHRHSGSDGSSTINAVNIRAQSSLENPAWDSNVQTELHNIRGLVEDILDPDTSTLENINVGHATVRTSFNATGVTTSMFNGASFQSTATSLGEFSAEGGLRAQRSGYPGTSMHFRWAGSAPRLDILGSTEDFEVRGANSVVRALISNAGSIISGGAAANTPRFTRRGDTNTGIAFPANSEVSIRTNNSEALRATQTELRTTGRYFTLTQAPGTRFLDFKLTNGSFGLRQYLSSSGAFFAPLNNDTMVNNRAFAYDSGSGKWNAQGGLQSAGDDVATLPMVEHLLDGTFSELASENTFQENNTFNKNVTVKGTLHLTRNSSGGINIQFPNGYAFYGEPTSSADGASNRLWISGPANGEVVIGPRGGSESLTQIRLRGRVQAEKGMSVSGGSFSHSGGTFSHSGGSSTFSGGHLVLNAGTEAHYVRVNRSVSDVTRYATLQVDGNGYATLSNNRMYLRMQHSNDRAGISSSSSHAPIRTWDVLQNGTGTGHGLTIRSGTGTSNTAGHLWADNSDFVIDSRSGNLTNGKNLRLRTNNTNRLTIASGGAITLHSSTTFSSSAAFSGSATFSSSVNFAGNIAATGDIRFSRNATNSSLVFGGHYVSSSLGGPNIVTYGADHSNTNLRGYGQLRSAGTSIMSWNADGVTVPSNSTLEVSGTLIIPTA